MARSFQLIKNQDFLKSFKFSLLEYQNEFNVISNQHFSNKLGFKNHSQFTNLTNEFSDKYIKVDELFLIMDNLGNHTKPILDYMCNRYGFLCTPSAPAEKTNDNFQDIFLDIANIQGDLAKTYLEAMQDGNLDDEEYKQIDKLLYQFRALVKGYEHG
jgi:hypothetical protein